MMMTIRSTHNNPRSSLLTLTVTFLLWQYAHALLRGASSSSSEDDTSTSSQNDMPPDACFTIDDRAGGNQGGMRYNNLVVFGDSFSDVGNIWEASNRTQPSWPPYYQGRYSNGRNYVDFVGEALPLMVPVSTNTIRAWGGATTNNELVLGYSTFLNATVPSFQDQVRGYLNQSADSPCHSSNTTTTLYVAVIGYNDYWWYANDNVTSNTTLQDMDRFVDRVTSSIIDTVQELVDHRGGCDSGGDNNNNGDLVLVGNLPPMDLLPDAQSMSDTVREAYRFLTETHNAKLQQRLLDSFGPTGPKGHPSVRLLPVHETLTEWVDQAPCVGFDEAAAACVSSNGTVCEDQYRHIFLDDWHPMTWTHQKLAHAVLTTAAAVAPPGPPMHGRR